MCFKFNNCINALQSRVTKVYANQIIDDVPFTILYGALVGLAALGREVIRVSIIPHLRIISYSIEPFLNEPSKESESIIVTSAAHIRSLIRKHCPIVLIELHDAPDIEEVYVEEYAYLGKYLYYDVVELRQLPNNAELPTNIFKPVPEAQHEDLLDDCTDYILNVPRLPQNNTEASLECDEAMIYKSVQLDSDFGAVNKPYVPSIDDIRKSLVNSAEFNTLESQKDQQNYLSKVIETKMPQTATPQELQSTSIMPAELPKSTVPQSHKQSNTDNDNTLKLMESQKMQSNDAHEPQIAQLISDNLAPLDLSISEKSSSSCSDSESTSDSDSESASDSDNEPAAQQEELTTPSQKRYICMNEPQKRMKLNIEDLNHESSETPKLQKIQTIGSYSEFDACATSICAVELQRREEALPNMGTELLLKKRDEEYSPANFQLTEAAGLPAPNQFKFDNPQTQILYGLLERTEVNWPKYKLGGLTPPPPPPPPPPSKVYPPFDQAIAFKHSTSRKPYE